MAKLSDIELQAARAFIAARDREAQILGQMAIAFEHQRARMPADRILQQEGN